MAKNRRRSEGRYLSLNVSAVNGSGAADLVKSGDPVAVGQIPGVALIDEGSDGLATVDTQGVYALPVFGHDGTANAAIAAGDKLVWDNTGGTLEKSPGSANSVPYGYALEPVASGATTIILVKIQPGA